MKLKLLRWAKGVAWRWKLKRTYAWLNDLTYKHIEHKYGKSERAW